MIEQPLWHNDFYFHSLLQRQLETSICLDESIRNRRDALAAIEMESCRIINIKLGRVGGFSEAIRVHNVTAERGIPAWCGGMLETGIGRSHNIALSSLQNFILPGDVSASARYWEEDIIEPSVEVSRKGEITVPQVAGRGFEVKRERVEKLTVRSERLHARNKAHAEPAGSDQGPRLSLDCGSRIPSTLPLDHGGLDWLVDVAGMFSSQSIASVYFHSGWNGMIVARSFIHRHAQGPNINSFPVIFRHEMRQLPAALRRFHLFDADGASWIERAQNSPSVFDLSEKLTFNSNHAQVCRVNPYLAANASQNSRFQGRWSKVRIRRKCHPYRYPLRRFDGLPQTC